MGSLRFLEILAVAALVEMLLSAKKSGQLDTQLLDWLHSERVRLIHAVPLPQGTISLERQFGLHRIGSVILIRVAEARAFATK